MCAFVLATTLWPGLTFGSNPEMDADIDAASAAT